MSVEERSVTTGAPRVSLWMSELLAAPGAADTVASLATPVTVIDGGTPARDVDELLRADEGLRCIAVRGDAPGQHVGLLSRTRFQHSMSGRLGFGRILHAGKPVAALTDWSPLLVRADTPVVDVARQVLRELDVQRITDVLVCDPGTALRHVEVADVFRALSAQLATKALTDPLTGLANRDHFMQHLQACCDDSDPRQRLALLHVDLDGFKAVNDGHGHGVGDHLLQVVADRLRCCCSPEDLPARLGGDEFAVIARLPPGIPVATAARELGERVRACLSGPIAVDSLVLLGRASTGVAVSGRVVADAEMLLREADLAMYQAKAAGGDRVEVITDVGGGAAVDSFNPDRRELQHALEDHQFLVHYQPIVETGTGRLASLEALVRWRHPVRGLLAPCSFLEAVTDAGLALDLDLHVLRVALGRFSRWQRELGDAAPPFLNVNVSVQGLLHPDLLPMVLETLSATGVAPWALRMELPETATLAHLDAAQGVLDALREAGVRLTLDDMGAGASTLQHLTSLTLDGVKIDRRFVAGLLDDERDAAVVRMLLDLGLSTDLAVTAEGVETEQQLRWLQAMARGRTTFVQGHLVSRPVPAEELPLPWPDGIHRPGASCTSPTAPRPRAHTAR